MPANIIADTTTLPIDGSVRITWEPIPYAEIGQTLVPNQTYKWKVKASNDYGKAKSVARRFTTDG